MKTSISLFVLIGFATVFLTGMEGCELEDDPVSEPADFMWVDPANNSTIQQDTEIILYFNRTPLKPSATVGTLSRDATKVTLTGPFAPGPLPVLVVWDGGAQALSYTVADPAADLLGDWHVSVIDGEPLTIETAPEEGLEIVELTVTFVFDADRSFVFEAQMVTEVTDFDGTPVDLFVILLGLEDFDEPVVFEITSTLKGTYAVSDATLTLTPDAADVEIAFTPKAFWDVFADEAEIDIEALEADFKKDFAPDFDDVDDVDEFTWELRGKTLLLTDVETGEKTILWKR